MSGTALGNREPTYTVRNNGGGWSIIDREANGTVNLHRGDEVINVPGADITEEKDVPPEVEEEPEEESLLAPDDGEAGVLPA